MRDYNLYLKDIIGAMNSIEAFVEGMSLETFQAGMRDRLIHAYFGVDYQLVWMTIKKRLPQAKQIIEQIQQDMG